MLARRSLLTLCALAVAGLVGATVLRPALRASKRWRAERLVAESQAYWQEQSTTVALQKAQAAYLLDVDTPAVLRHFATLATLQDLPLALDLWERLLAPSDVAQDSDFAAALGLAIKSRRFDRAYPWLDAWQRRFPDPSPARRRSQAFFLAAVGDTPALRAHLAAWRESPATLPADVRLLEAHTMLVAPAPEERAEAARRLLALGDEDDPAAVDALRACIDVTDTSIAIAAAENLYIHPRASVVHRVAAALVLHRAGRAMEDQIRECVRESLRGQDPAGRRPALAVLLAAGRADLILDSLEASTAQADGELFALQLEACLRVGRHADVLALTADAGAGPLTPAVSLVFRARAHLGQGDTEKAHDSLRKAIEAATDEDHVFVERAVLTSGGPPLSLAYYQHLAAHPRLGRLARAGALAAAYEAGDEATMLRLLEEVDLPAARASLPLARRAVYLLLLAGVRTDEARLTAEALFEERGGDTDSRLLLAFANARAGRTAIARDLVAAVAPESLPDVAAQVMFWSICGAATTGTFDGRPLLPTERELLARAAVTSF